MWNGEQQGKLDQEIFEALEASRKHFESLVVTVFLYGQNILNPWSLLFSFMGTWHGCASNNAFLKSRSNIG